MSRYIDADEAIQIWEEKDYIRLSKQEQQAKKMLDELPSADVVKVVRCKDCKHWREFMAGLGVCDKLKTDMDGSSYCNYGEQSEEVKDNERK